MKVNIINHVTGIRDVEGTELKLLSRNHVISILRMLSENRDGIQFKSIAYGLMQNPSGASSLLKEMIKVGWVEHERGELYHITKKGGEVYETAKKLLG